MKRKVLMNNISPSPTVERIIRWIALDKGWLKLNMDTSLYDGGTSFTLGMVIQDELGRFVKGKNLRIQGSAIVMEAEARGVQEALYWKDELVIHHVIMECDSSLVVNAVQNNLVYHLEVGHTLEFCNSQLKHRKDLSLRHIRKQANQVLQNPPLSSSFRHGQMQKVLKNRYGPMSEHRVLTQADDHHQRGHTNVRVPLSQHPLFTRAEENVHECDRNVRVPLSQHPLFTQSNENEHPNIGLKNNGCLKENLRALAKSCSGRIPLSEHPMVKDSLRKGTDFNTKVQHLHSKGLGQTNRNNGSSPAMLPKSRIDGNEMAPRKTLKRKYNCSLEEVSRSLFSDADYSTPDDFDDSVYSIIENSRIVGVDDSDDGMFSDDEIDASSTGDVLSDGGCDFDDEYYTNNRTAEYANLGAPSFKYEFCQSYMWKEERVNKNITRGRPLFSICCRKGHVKLPNANPTPSFLRQLYTDPKKGAQFKKALRVYNSMFSFTSTRGTVDNSINNGGGPYIYRLNGQNHHVFCALIPNDGTDPKFCQLYIYDTENELSNRMQWIDVKDGDKIDSEIVDGLMKMLDETNELVKEFRVARDRFKDSPYVDLKIVLKVCHSESGRETKTGLSNEVAAIMVGDVEDPCFSRDIIIEKTAGGLQRVTNIHPKLMALQYPLLFPNGEDDFHKDILYVQTPDNKGKKWQKCTMKDFYSYNFQVRHNEGMTPRLGGRLFQQYIVDAFSAIEQSRLWWFRTHQTTLRNELYSHICDSLRKGDGDAANVGKSFILPAGFVGSKRYMQQNFQDALAVCHHVGHPDIFMTMTCNPMWDEIMQMLKLIPGGTSVDNPDVVARVFRLKLDQLLHDIQKKSFFGVCIGVMYIVEFQKRGLPYVHMLIWLDSASKNNLKANVDKFVSAEIPDPDKDPVGYATVKLFMIHGPCGANFIKSPCMTDFKCTRHFPKKYSASTTFDESGFPI